MSQFKLNDYHIVTVSLLKKIHQVVDVTLATFHHLHIRLFRIEIDFIS